VFEQVKTEIADVQYVCTTADIWSQQARSYLGVTCHWIYPAKLIRRSAVLAFCRFYGTHSFDRIGALLMSVHTQFDLDTSKITHVVTDNGSNFMKAFRQYDMFEKLLFLKKNSEFLNRSYIIGFSYCSDSVATNAAIWQR